MSFNLIRSRPLTAVIVICAILGATLLVPVATATTLTFVVEVSSSGASQATNLITKFPQAVSLSVKGGSPGMTFLWQFGDGTSSTASAPTHTYDNPFVYHVQVQVTASNGSTLSGVFILGMFDKCGQSGRCLAVSPSQGTAGIASVGLAGGIFPARQSVEVMMNGTSVATVTADGVGDWVLNVTGLLASMPGHNDTQYAFSTSPPSLTRSFTTLEGIGATPSSGPPGTTVLVEGRSYPPFSSVLIYLGDAGLGTAQADVNGSFQGTFQIPLTATSTQPYVTFPGILGSQASFASTGTTGLVLSLWTSWWWWLIVIPLFLIAAFFALRWSRRRRAPPA